LKTRGEKKSEASIAVTDTHVNRSSELQDSQKIGAAGVVTTKAPAREDATEDGKTDFTTKGTKSTKFKNFDFAILRVLRDLRVEIDSLHQLTN
jgi:hypothetical protein